MRITTVKDKDGMDAIIIDFSNQKSCRLNNIQLDSLKIWLNENWSDNGLIDRKVAP